MSEAGEFQIIEQFFTYPSFGAWKSQGVGDDCAIIDTGAGRLAVTCDMTALGTHFFPDADPEDVGYKALAVNLSDLAAAGAVPRAFFLSIGLPRRDDGWLADFSRGLMALAHESGCALLGGDTTRTPEIDGRHAPATISITAMGDLPAGMGLTRSGAQPGDDIWVSGTVGDAYAALMCRWGRWQVMPDAEPRLFARMDRPTPRIALGQALLGAATACADISDGLLADLDHILTRSGVSAEIEWERIPLSPVLSTLTVARQHEAALAGGDDYELIFTAPPAAAERIFEAGLLSNTPVSRIGRILEREETGAQLGTTIMVENLFFNVPVRYKFLKQDATEFKYIKDWIQKAALSIPSISFKLINEGKVCFQSNGNGKIEDVIYSIYGKEIKENLVKVNFEEDDVKVTGVIGNTMVARDSRKDQILFLNKRNIKNQVLINSADQAFKGSTGIGAGERASNC